MLDDSIKTRLTLISAPAGFGKSSLTAVWSKDQKKSAWISIDESDNDPVSFFCHFYYSFNRLNPELGTSALAALQDRENVNFNSLIYTLINEINDFNEPLFLILDDYHLIIEDIIHKTLQILLDRMPDQLHLILLTRSDPPFSLARLRNSEQIIEIRAEHLKFSIAETDSFLNKKWLLHIESDEIRHIHSRTEGWITGLQLSAFSLDKMESKSEFIQNLKGDDRYIADYLVEQVLNNLSRKMKNFLLKISILNRLCGSLTDFVSGESNTAELLLQMEKDNLFLIPLDNKRKWFRFHHLFAELLRQRFSGKKQDVHDLHNRASDWFESNGYHAEAIDHAIRSEKPERIISFIEKYANDFLMKRGETKNLLNWLKRIPEKLIDSSARLNLTYAWVLFYEYALPQIKPYLDNVEKLLEKNENKDIRAEYETVLATIAVLKGNLDIAVDKYRFALQTISPDNFLMRGAILFGLGYGCITLGHLSEADKILEEAGTVNKKIGNVSISLKSFCFLAMCRIQAGKTAEARNSVSKAFEIAAETGLENAPIMSLAYSIYAELDRNENNLIRAAENASTSIEISKKHEDYFRLYTAYTVMAAIKETQQLYTGALAYIAKSEELIQGKAAHLSSVRTKSIRNRIFLKLNNFSDDEFIKPDENWLSLSGAIMIPGQICEFEHLTYVRYLIRKEKFSDAETILDYLQARLEDSEKVNSKIEILFHQMILQLEKGNRSGGKEIIKKLIVYTEESNNCALFLEYPDITMPIIQEIITENDIGSGTLNFLNRLSATLKTAGEKQSTPELITPLSGREREVILLLDTGMTNKEIAEKLFVSVNTLKTHIKSINNKLDTANRKEACVKARQLGLL
jgi:LuxR family transcriptional regulator, maltose regulon positive regulatory protein